MAAKHGSLSINSENIFPIIKKWLYSDHDIFVREMVSNGCDAITKLKKLEVMGEYSFPDDYKAQINVIVNPEEKTLKFIDTGLGMTADEVEEYITQIAFSGATEFLEKYKDKTTDDQMIGHFGLGFYSAFMVADEVHIDTLSYKEGSTAVHWTCDGGTEYDIQDGNKNTVGTEITLFLNEDSLEFSNEYRMREVLEKYCSFMPVNIYLSKANAEQEYETIEESDLRDDDVIVERIHEEAKTEEKENENGEKEIVEVSPAKDKVKINKRPVSLSDTHPLWTKHPNECDDEDYRSFYRKVFLDYKEPLFWIHLNMDYPFNLKGILYFPKINTEYDSIEGTIKLYNNQVFIADNIKEVIPEFLMLLKGVIDCPDLPLNVSRSALQNDGFVQKISEYITKKVADKLTGMCKTDRESYEKYWDDISPFIKFGCIKDQKFSEKMMDYILFKNLDDQYLTLKDCIEKNKKETDESITEETTTEEQDKENKEEDSEKEPKKTILYYVTDPVQQSQYINLFKEQGMDAVILRHNIDTAFISHLEQLNQEIRFQRIDADVTDSLKEDAETDEELAKSLTELFRKNLNKEKLEVKVEKLKNENLSAMMTLSEDSRRMQEMMKMYNMYGMDPNMFGGDETLVLNANHPLVQFVVEHQDSQKVPIICEQLYDLAMLSHKQLSPEEMTRFVNRSNEIMMMLTDIKA
ncbi:molecular chaperone HtpG [Blautia hydrogenotrophica]|uniref:molecular chaperone HtpG n=1 Tax=Blautia hydrogenotrophica TaxID=53443 RepID=UPI002E77DDE9|nr:molecular chaperone HtpG [Blautia hydrogenotrophica]MEE0461467.1 molecular chaperone HtpG [Blautia hydrogenotrophica]